MKIRNKKLYGLLAAGLCCLTVISGCGEEKKVTEENAQSETAPVQESSESEEQQTEPVADEGNIGEFSMQDITWGIVYAGNVRGLRPYDGKYICDLVLSVRRRNP